MVNRSLRTERAKDIYVYDCDYMLGVNAGYDVSIGVDGLDLIQPGYMDRFDGIFLYQRAGGDCP